MTKPLPLPSPSVVSEKLSPMEPRALTVRVRVRVRVRRARYANPNPIPNPNPNPIPNPNPNRSLRWSRAPSEPAEVGAEAQRPSAQALRAAWLGSGLGVRGYG